jgi:hypothetical protein
LRWIYGVNLPSSLFQKMWWQNISKKSYWFRLNKDVLSFIRENWRWIDIYYNSLQQWSVQHLFNCRERLDWFWYLVRLQV